MQNNALKYNVSTPRKVNILYQEESRHHKFSVTDNGIGIAKDKQDVFFQLFTSIPKDVLKPTTGIGTVKNLVNKLDSKIVVTSEWGKGSTFTFAI